MFFFTSSLRVFCFSVLTFSLDTSGAVSEGVGATISFSVTLGATLGFASVLGVTSLTPSFFSASISSINPSGIIEVLSCSILSSTVLSIAACSSAVNRPLFSIYSVWFSGFSTTASIAALVDIILLFILIVFSKAFFLAGSFSPSASLDNLSVSSLKRLISIGAF